MGRSNLPAPLFLPTLCGSGGKYGPLKTFPQSFLLFYRFVWKPWLLRALCPAPSQQVFKQTLTVHREALYSEDFHVRATIPVARSEVKKGKGGRDIVCLDRKYNILLVMAQASALVQVQFPVEHLWSLFVYKVRLDPPIDRRIKHSTIYLW